MPITAGAIRKMRADKRKTAVNLKTKKAYKSKLAQFRKKPSAKGLVGVFSGLDRAAKTGVIHRNKAARLKSRLARLLKK